MANKRKTTTAIVAGVTAVALLLGGTFAWTSISQQAKNEAIVDINPGGRLHDDFNGTNKDVYVENFGDETTGVPIFARIRLYEYMEIGQQAGNKTIADGERKADSLIDGATIGDTKGWAVYKYGETSEFTKYWSWKLGNNDETTLPYYMPTFNMNKDSLAADINGTYEGTVEGDIVHYDDYIQYDATSTKTDTEVYDHDSNTNEEEKGTTADGVPAYSTTDPEAPIDDAHVRLNENQEHKAEQISTTSTIMSMQEWKDAGSQPGNYWVFDTDGWAYWAQPIGVGQTTGLLLDSIEMIRVPDDSWYYGINVVAQFATEGDISAFNSGNSDEETWTSDAEDLFAKINKAEAVTIDGKNSVEPGGTATFTATRTVGGAVAGNQPTFTWTATDANNQPIDGVTIDDYGTLTVAEDVADDTEITVTATATTEAEGEGEAATALSASKVVTVRTIPALAYTITDEQGQTLDSYFSLDSGMPYISSDMANTDGETILFTVNRNIDLDASIGHINTNTDNSGVTVVLETDTDGEDTLRITSSGQEFTGMGFDSVSGMRRILTRLMVVTEYDEEINVDFMLKATEDSDLELNVNGGVVTDNITLNNGDQFVASSNGQECQVFSYDFLAVGASDPYELYDYDIYEVQNSDGWCLNVKTTETRQVDMVITYLKDGQFYYKKFTNVTINGNTSADATN